ncbi:hypothetical protein KCP70_08380 [Salmonella enterica subsp. enterica]|nr:hypothetical protein KCP70_08380 [Salmonella enterica subsp. enterica]
MDNMCHVPHSLPYVYWCRHRRMARRHWPSLHDCLRGLSDHRRSGISNRPFAGFYPLSINVVLRRINGPAVRCPRPVRQTKCGRHRFAKTENSRSFTMVVVGLTFRRPSNNGAPAAFDSGGDGGGKSAPTMPLVSPPCWAVTCR